MNQCAELLNVLCACKQKLWITGINKRIWSHAMTASCSCRLVQAINNIGWFCSCLRRNPPVSLTCCRWNILVSLETAKIHLLPSVNATVGKAAVSSRCFKWHRYLQLWSRNMYSNHLNASATQMHGLRQGHTTYHKPCPPGMKNGLPTSLQTSCFCSPVKATKQELHQALERLPSIIVLREVS